MNKEILYAQMYKIRKFEETLLKLFSDNKLKGTTHTSIGQEANAVAVLNNVTDKDYVFSNHRCHGHFIAYSDNINVLMAEIMGKENGMCKGRGGSQHICYKNFFTNGVQGGIVPNATGLAFSEKLKNSDGIAVVFIGDGTLGQGIVYESFNLASLYNIPILYVIEDNGYAMSTSIKYGVAGSIVKRAQAFGIKTSEIKSNDVEILEKEMEEAFNYVRKHRKPYCEVLHTYRLGPHSKGDDFRDKKEIAEWHKQDPLKIIKSKIDANIIKNIEQKIDKDILVAVAYAESGSYEKSHKIYNELNPYHECNESLLNITNERVSDNINKGLNSVLGLHNNTVLIGEDIKDPYGGAFKVTKNLSLLYPERVINMPISEAGFTGLAIGMAMNGIIPIVEIMFGDFVTLCFDQIINHATKYNWMYANQVNVPIIIRLPMGGGRGYGATHSQSLEKYLIGIPNLQVIALSRIIDSNKLLNRIVKNISGPTIIIENKKMYAEKLYKTENGKIGLFKVTESNSNYPIYKLSLVNNNPDITIITYGAMTDLAMTVAQKLMIEDEIIVNILVNTCISPIDIINTQKNIGSCKNIITLEENTLRNGWGAEVIAQLSELINDRKYKRVAALDCTIPSGNELESNVLPNEEKIIKTIRSMLNE